MQLRHAQYCINYYHRGIKYLLNNKHKTHQICIWRLIDLSKQIVDELSTLIWKISLSRLYLLRHYSCFKLSLNFLDLIYWWPIKLNEKYLIYWKRRTNRLQLSFYPVDSGKEMEIVDRKPKIIKSELVGMEDIIAPFIIIHDHT